MRVWVLIVALLLPNVGGWLSSISVMGQVSRPDGDSWYDTINKPSWTPPNWVFGPAWTVFYTMIGFSSYLVYRDGGGFTEKSQFPLTLYLIHLFVNWTWTPVFFGLHKLGLALLHIVILDILAVGCAISFYMVNRWAAGLFLPYIAWSIFATCLTATLWHLN
ncbi:translocator protein [Bombyx mori]|uniref:Translocator protein n=1 Tax=Bombyx mori TaxID=7091 RepID=A0A8R1WH76_BOMMO|nr:translocator protein [Bombyx mori]